jgi:hypothetical protein
MFATADTLLRQQARIPERISFPLQLQVSKQLMGNNGEVRGNRVPLRAVVCSRVTQYAHMPAHVESCWQRASTFCVPPISERNLLPHRVRALCANCEGCACSRGLLYTLTYVGVCWHRTSPPVASCILYRASGASARATSCFLLLACSFCLDLHLDFSLARSLSFSLACSLARAHTHSLSLPPSLPLLRAVVGLGA